MHRNGLGRKPNPAQALKWYLLAGAAGYQTEGFEQVLEEIKRELKPEEIKKAEADAQKWITDFRAKNAPATAAN
jgi:TPR repeat protein